MFLKNFVQIEHKISI